MIGGVEDGPSSTPLSESPMLSNYYVRRLARMLLTIWIGATAIFIIPRLGGVDPADAVAGQLFARGIQAQNSEAIIEAYLERLGYDQSVWSQYFKFLKGAVTFDNGISISRFPVTVDELVRSALPWTLGLLGTSILIAFVLGNVIGAVMGWPKTRNATRMVLTVPVLATALPSFMVGLILMSIFSFQLGWLPSQGAYQPGLSPGWNLPFIRSLVEYAALPAGAVILARTGGFALGMRGMMITTAGSDYMQLAAAKGLSRRRTFFQYGVRNTILPQITELGVALGSIAGGFIIVERVFTYPGIGTLLYEAVKNSDFPLIQGVVVYLIVGVAVAAFVLDLIYPLLDPRISRGTQS